MVDRWDPTLNDLYKPIEIKPQLLHNKILMPIFMSFRWESYWKIMVKIYIKWKKAYKVPMAYHHRHKLSLHDQAQDKSKKDNFLTANN